MNTLTARGVSIVGTLILAAALPGLAAPPVLSTQGAPAYNPSMESRLSGVITGVRRVNEGPLAGVHITVQSKAKNEVADVYLAPADFLKIFKTDFPAGAYVQVIGARTRVGDTEVVLAREVTEGDTSITLRDFGGAPVWEHWGAVADPAMVVGG